MALIDDCRTAIRISHNKLDNDIQSSIDSAKAEMQRAGVDITKIVDTDPLIVDAIKVYCKYSFASDMKMREGFFNSFQYQLDCLRKSTGYMLEVVEDV